MTVSIDVMVGVLDLLWIFKIIFVLISHCYVKHNYYKHSNLKQHTLLISQCPLVRSLGTLDWGSHKAAIKGMTGAGVSSEAQGPLPSTGGCWQNSVPCNCRAHSNLLLQGQQEKNLLSLDQRQKAHQDKLPFH